MLAIALCCASVSAASAAKRAGSLQRVTVFGDSVAAALNWDSAAKKVMERGNRVTFDLAPCRRLTQPGCISPPPPSVLHDVRRLGRRLAPTVVVLVGYNDDPATYRHGLVSVLNAMWGRGVKHVLWLTLRAINKQYVDINHAIYAAAQKWQPWMTVLDWNHYSATRPSWFASDRIHLSSEGAVQLATYLHRALKQLGLTGRLPLSEH